MPSSLAQEPVSPLLVTTPTPTPGPVLGPLPAHGLPAHIPEGERTYTVREGDTLLDVALEVGVDLEETYCLVAPDFTWEQPLVIGDVLSVPPFGVVCHAVTPGETLASVAAHYEVPAAAIAALPWNRLPDAPAERVVLRPDTHLRIPLQGAALARSADGFLSHLSQPIAAAPPGAWGESGSLPLGKPGVPAGAPLPADWPYGSGRFAWPMAGWLTQGYDEEHRAIDIAAPAGTLVTAADRGVVLRAGWNDQGYGNFVVVDHQIDYISLYAHLSEVLVKEGQVVAQGAPIGHVGSTGNSTGPHLHFEIRDFGRRTDPIPLLIE